MSMTMLPDVERWTARRKCAVAALVHSDQRLWQQAMEKYGVSREELSHWIDVYVAKGWKGLRVNQIPYLRNKLGGTGDDTRQNTPARTAPACAAQESKPRGR